MGKFLFCPEILNPDMYAPPDQVYGLAKQLLYDCASPFGFLASPVDETNYRRVWARDGVICGIAGLVSGDEKLRAALVATIETLGSQQGPQGQIPSNVQVDEAGNAVEVSYGGLCGRVDTLTWFVIGYAMLGLSGEDSGWVMKHKTRAAKALELLEAWEFNGRGLVYVPMSGHWADEYLLHGYVLYDQLLRLWALRLMEQLFPGETFARRDHAALIQANYDFSREADEALLYHAHARRLAIQQTGKPQYLTAAFSPGGYQMYFDLFAQALAFGQGIPSDTGGLATISFVEKTRKNLPFGLAPAFWPVVFPGENDWRFLEANHKYHFRNEPYGFQNGGLWPVFNGWWGVALAASGFKAEAGDMLKGLSLAVTQPAEGSDFYEFIHGQSGNPMGTPRLGWTAAGWLLAWHALQNEFPIGWHARSLTPLPS